MFARLLILSVLVLAAPVRAQWQPNGLVLYDGQVPHLIEDGAGGVVVAWNYLTCCSPTAVMGQRLSVAGHKLWGSPQGILLCPPAWQWGSELAPDGAGGAIFAWRDEREVLDSDIYAQRVSGAGGWQWPVCGIPVCTEDSTQAALRIIPDGSSGAIITWWDERGPGNAADIYAQRIDVNGNPLWIPQGAAVCIAAGVQDAPAGAPDGLGGAWFAWVDGRGPNTDIYVRHVNAAGTPLGGDGIPVCAAAGDQVEPVIISDESGGAVIAWGDRRAGPGADVYAQRVSAAGAVMWTANGVAVCTEFDFQQQIALAPDGSGGAIAVWADERADPASYRAYAQRVDGAGVPQWTAGGNLLGQAITPYGYSISPAIIANESGGAIVAWVDVEFIGLFPSYVLRVQQLDANGAAQWPGEGVEVSRFGNEFGGSIRFPALAVDGWGGAFVAWNSGPDPLQSQVYAAHVTGSGTVVDVAPARGPSIVVANVYPNPFSGTASLTIELAAPSAVQVEIFDVAGRQVGSLVRNDAARSHVVSIPDRDDAGRLLPSGVYFCRLQAAGETVTRKMVIAR